MKKINYILGETQLGTKVETTLETENDCISICGMSGTGKSTVSVSLMIQAVNKGASVINIGRGRSNDYSGMPKKLREAYEAKVKKINIAKDGFLCHLLKNSSDEHGNNIETDTLVVQRAKESIARSCNLTDDQALRLKEALTYMKRCNRFSESGIGYLENIMTLDSKDNVMKRAYAKLEPIISENLIREGTFWENKPLIYEMDLNDLDLATQDIMTKFILEYTYRAGLKNFFKENPVYLFIDECQHLDFSTDSAVATLLNEGRKMGINLILATQRLFAGRKHSKKDMRILSQCSTKIFFHPSDDELSDIAAIISPAKPIQALISLNELKVGEFIVSGHTTLPSRVVTPVQATFPWLK